MRHINNMLAALAMVGLITCGVQAKTYSQKTFMSPRPIGFYSPMEYTTWHDHVYKKRENPHLHTHFMVTGFYVGSQNDGGIAKYFGAGDGSHGLSVGTLDQLDAGQVNIWNQLLIKSVNPSTLAGTITFDPEQEMWGARLDFFQDVFKPFNAMYFKASLPIVYVQNNMGMTVANGHTMVIETGNKTVSLQDFLAGRVDNSSLTDVSGNDNPNMLNPLKKAKIDGRRTKTGASDLDLTLGYKFHQAKNSHFFGHVDCLVPLGNHPRGDYLFEPVIGNGGHVGLGLGIDAGASLWHNKRSDVTFLATLNYQYLLERNESRTIPVKNAALTSVNINSFTHYLALGQNGQVARPLEPAANILTRDVSVRPGSTFDGSLAFAFKSSGFTIDLGYNLYFKDKESVKLPTFEDGVWGISTSAFDTSSIVTQFNDGTTIGGLITKDALDMTAITSPWQTTHSIFGGFGYTTKMYKKYPASVGIGGAYEFAADNAAQERASVWLKAMFSF